MKMNATSTAVRRAIQITKLFEIYDIEVGELETICSIQDYADIAHFIAGNLPLTSETALRLANAIKEIDNAAY